MRVLTGSISTYVFTMLHGRALFLTLFRAPGLTQANTWQAVHGMIEGDEPAQAAARREMLEETGLSAERFFKVDCVETFFSELTDAVHLVPVFAAFVTGAPAAAVSAEHTAAEWCSLDDTMNRFQFRGQRDAVRTIAEAAKWWPDVTPALTELIAAG